MRYFLLIILALFQSGTSMGQDKIVELSLEDLNKNGAIYLQESEHWLYHSGNNPDYASDEIETMGWQSISPTQISKDLADQNNRIEGWFKIKIKVDEDLAETVDYLYISNYGQAIDLYVNGKKLSSVGNIGSGDDPYVRSSNPNQPIPFDFTADSVLNLALHYVCESPGSLAFKLMNTNSFGFGVFVSNQEFVDARKTRYEIEPYNQFFTVTVCFVLSLLFTVLYFQNRKEKSFGHIVIISWLFFVSALLSMLEQEYNIPRIGYNGVLYISRLQGVFGACILYYSVIIFSSVFTQKRPKRHGLVFFVFLLLVVEFTFIQNQFLAGSLLFAILVINTSYILKNYKNATKAQWSIIIGFLVIIVSVLSYFIIFILTGLNSHFVFFTFYLSFPLSLVFYVSFRFKEIISEVRKNADKVVKLTEEKRQQALNQQEILELQVEERTKELNQSIENLKSTQTQLIHAEKMASLGELTAGIAHEIQNPLNFVNNFSEVSNEMIKEIQEERGKKKEDRDEDLTDEILSDIEQNLEKINHHGKRAGDIVKGMLQHSRVGSGTKEPTDINALCDEYLRLAYHGLRAKDKSFNAKFETDFDTSLTKIDIVPQDMGRVVLNLINNAFYAVNEKALRQAKGDNQAEPVEAGYEPQVSVSTKKEGDKVLISVKDNGNGIPEQVREKIFQPFFTTKPTGSGTGLGLSLSYDIVKVHGGELKVETKENEGTEFIISIADNL